jgi:hypothetical protein
MNRVDLRLALNKSLQALRRWSQQIVLGGLQALRRWGRQGILAAAVLGFAIVYPPVLILLAAYGQPAPRVAEQPVAFNHRIHVQDLGLECSDCHEFFESETFAGLPKAETCAMCHEEAQGESSEEERLVKLLAEGKPLAWQHLFLQPAHVFYSHRRHVTVAGLECERCHGSFAETETPPKEVEILSMDACIDCHHERQASTDCTVCHR